MRSLGLALALTFAVAFPASAQTIIDTGLPATADNGYLVNAGVASGQTFTVPALDHVLYSFAFTLVHTAGTLPAHAFIQEWTGTGTTGDVLFGGGLATSIGSSPLGGTARLYTWDIGGAGLALRSGAQYLAFVTGDLAGTDGAWDVLAFLPSDTYSGGVSAQAILDGGSISDEPWIPYSRSDLAFTASLGPASAVVPEPSTVILLGSGLLGLGIVAWRRREREA